MYIASKIDLGAKLDVDRVAEGIACCKAPRKAVSQAFFIFEWQALWCACTLCGQPDLTAQTRRLVTGNFK